MGPAFSTPYQERIRAARSSDKQVQLLKSGPQPPRPHEDKSEALKRLLFNKQPPTPNTPSVPGQRTNHSVGIAATSPPAAAVANNFQQIYGNVPKGAVGDQSAISAMEDNLRRILNLNPSSGVGPSAAFTPQK